MLNYLLIYFLQGFFVTAVGFALIGIKVDLNKLVFIATMHSPIIYFSREIYSVLKLPLGTHTIIILVSYIIIYRIVLKSDFINIIMAILIGFSLIGLQESILLIPIKYIFNIENVYVFIENNLKYRFFVTIFSQIPLYILFMVSYICKVHIIDMSKNDMSKNDMSKNI